MTLNRNYPSLCTLTSIIVQQACAACLKDGYSKGEATPIIDYIEAAFTLHPWEADGPREQVLRELEFLGFAW